MTPDEQKGQETIEQKQENPEPKSEANFESIKDLNELIEQRTIAAKQQVDEMIEYSNQGVEHANDSIGLSPEQADTIKKSEGVDEKINEVQNSAQEALNEFRQKAEEYVKTLMNQAILNKTDVVNANLRGLNPEQQTIVANAFSKEMERLQAGGEMPLKLNIEGMDKKAVEEYLKSPETQSMLAKLQSEKTISDEKIKKGDTEKRDIEEMERYMIFEQKRAKEGKELGPTQQDRLAELRAKYPADFFSIKEKIAAEKEKNKK